MINEVKKDAGDRMGKSVENLKQEMTKVRTGRAHPSLVEHVMVDYYGTPTALNQVANVNISDARTLSISPWEKAMVPDIEKAIINSGLGLNPVTTGEVIRLPLPPLTEERRKDLVRVVRQEAEGARVAIRNIRRDAIGDLKDLEKEKMISEDELRKAETDIQDITNTYVAKVDEVLATKETDLMAV